MNEIDRPIEWLDGNGETVEIGYFNPHGQQCCGHFGVPGTDHGQYAYHQSCPLNGGYIEIFKGKKIIIGT